MLTNKEKKAAKLFDFPEEAMAAMPRELRGCIMGELEKNEKLAAEFVESRIIDMGKQEDAADKAKREARNATAKAIASGDMGTVIGKFTEKGFERGGQTTMENRNYDPQDFRSSEEYKRAFVKTLQGTASEEQRTLVTSATGAAVIPTSTFNEVIQNVQKKQGILSRVRIMKIPGNVSIPLSDINTPAGWHVEGEEIEDSNKTPGSLKLAGYELTKLFTLSAATKAMSIAAYEAYLVEELGRCTADALNAAIFSGVGTTQPTGINALTFDATNSVTTAGAKVITYDEMVSILALLASNFRQNAAWIMNSTTYYAYVATMKDTHGQPYFTDDRPLSKELIIDDFAPDNVIFLGDPAYYFLNFSEALGILADSSAGFSRGVTMYRSMAVVDGKPLPSGAFAKLIINQA